MEILKKKIQTNLNLYNSRKFSKAELLCKDLIKSNPKVVYFFFCKIFSESDLNLFISNFRKGTL